MNEHEQQAYDLGVEHAKAAASWITNGNTSQEDIARVLALMDDGDPWLDDYLPARPDLSGEWADSYTPLRLAQEIIDPDAFDWTVEESHAIDALADAYEAGVDTTFYAECERILRAALDA